jgi:polysaccharide export outer membrane protein
MCYGGVPSHDPCRFELKQVMNMPAHNQPRLRARPAEITSNLRTLVIASFLIFAVFLSAGCRSNNSASAADPIFHDPALLLTQATNPAPAIPVQLDPRTASYATNLLQEGDVISINFQFSTNFNTVQKIALDGMLNLESVGPVKAAGFTVTELQAAVSRLYKPQIKDDVVTVKFVNASDSVYISGAVIRPGKVPLERPMTALEGIMEAGGFDPTRARLSRVIIVRIEDGNQKTYKLNLRNALKGYDKNPFYLKPFDIVHVPTKTFNF